MRERFAALNRYDPSAIPARSSNAKTKTTRLVPTESLNRTRREQLYCYAVSEKLYALFNLDERGGPHVRKYSSLVLGQLRSPVRFHVTVIRAPDRRGLDARDPRRTR